MARWKARVEFLLSVIGFLFLSLKPSLHDTTGCQTSCTTDLTTGCIVLTTVLNEQPLVLQPVVKPGCTTGLTTGCIHDTAVCQTGWMFVDTIQPVVKPVWQQVVSCKPGFTVEALQGKRCQDSLLSGGGRSVRAKISEGKGHPWGIFFACDGRTDGRTERQTELL